MRFVIWGAGSRGKRAARFVGYYNVRAFVDTDERLVDTDYMGIPIFPLEALDELCRDCFLIISPANHEDIIKVLNEKKIDMYFDFGECPLAIFRGKIEDLEEISMPMFEADKTVIYGSSLYSILLWEKLQKKGYELPIWLDKRASSHIGMLKEILDRVYCEEAVDLSYDTILQTVKYIPEAPDKKVIDLYHVDKCVNKFFHPELHKFQGISRGRRCFIVGNGSSISCADLDKLNKYEEVCFGMNGIPLIFKDTEWRPSYYVCEDAKAMEVFGELVLNSKMQEIFLSDVNKDFLDKLSKAEKKYNINVFHMAVDDYFPDLPEFSDDIEKSIYNGRTVTYVCIQIAVYMGFREIYLMGIDFDYENGDTTQVKHFIKDYHLNSDKINPCRRTENLLAYQAARKYADYHGIKIYNATRGGKLEVFERVDFDSLFS